MFLLAFFTLVIKPETSLDLEILYVFDIALIHLLWFSLLSYFFTHKMMQKNLKNMQYYIVKTMGALLIGFGIKIGLLDIAD
jgi:threonine/homoserine/homoserine lactone efflux protein